MTTTLLHIIRQHRKAQSTKTNAESPLRRLTREAGIGHINEEAAEAYREKLTEDIRQPRNTFEHFLVRFFARHEVLYHGLPIGIVLTSALFTAVFIVGSIFWICLLFTINPVMIGTITLGSLVLAVSLYALVCYVMGLSQMAIIYWGRTDITPWTPRKELPSDVWEIFHRVYQWAEISGVRGIHYQVEFPCSEKINDPFFLITRGDETLYLAAFE